MSQKSILSFFKQTDKASQSKKSNDDSKPSIKSKSSKETAELDGHIQKEGSTVGCSNSSKIQNGFELTEKESPIKHSTKRKARVLESDEESNQSQDEVSNTVKDESEKMEVDTSSEVEGNSESNKDSTAKLNGDTSPLSKNSPKNCENDEIKNSSSKKIKIEDNPSPVKGSVLSSLSDSALNSPLLLNRTSGLPSTRASKLPPPPKRKTARKSMKTTNTIEIRSSPSEESKDLLKDSIFPNVKTYEKKNMKNLGLSTKESSSNDINCEDSDKEVKTETEISELKSKESGEDSSEKIASPQKPLAIHPFFVRKNKETSCKGEATKDSKESEEITDKDDSKNESSSSKSKKGKKKSTNECKSTCKSKETTPKGEAAQNNKESQEIPNKDKSCSENESFSPTSKKVQKKSIKDSKSTSKTQKKSPVTSVKESKSKNENNAEKVTESDKNSNSLSDGESSPMSKKNKKKQDDSEKDKDFSNGKNEKTLNSSSTSSGVHYDPSKSKYHPIDDACWKRNEKVPYLALAKTLELIENTSARLKIVEILANYLRSVIVLTPDDLLQSVYLCLNRIAPEYEGIELGVGDMVLMKAVAQATGRTLDKIRAEVKEKGDLGLVAESSRGNQKVMFAPPNLTVSSVFSKFKEIAKMSGNAAMAKKTDKIQALFVACRDCEAKYIIRSLSGKLRIGLAEQSVLAALGRAVVLTPPGQSYPPDLIDKSSGMSSEKFKKLQDEKTLILKTTYCECPNYDLVIPVLLKEGIDHLPEHCQLSPGCPLKPMLAHPTAGIDEVLQRFDNNAFTCEFKYDGERAQIHRTDENEIKIFSRNQEDNTSKYPDIIARLSKALKDTTKSFILDTEAVAWDQEKKQILPFQILSTRKKKDAAKSEIVVQVCVMAFDLLYLNGESLVKKPLKERRALLHSVFVEVPNEFMFVTYKDGNSAETMQEFLDESIKGNCEGLMVKALEVDASYEIAKRSHNWLKLKKDYLDGVGDTLDLVVIGGYHGKGKRTGTYGGFLLACYDNENEEFQSICKLGTGFKEDELEAHTKFLKNHVIDAPKSYYRFDHSLQPDEWFEPEQIWEVKCADLSISPIHKAAIGIVDPEKGISLRFPRFLRIRDDKKVEEATNSSQIAEMYQNQDQVQNMKAKPKNEEDYY